jgi:hypothetical protein
MRLNDDALDADPFAMGWTVARIIFDLSVSPETGRTSVRIVESGWCWMQSPSNSLSGTDAELLK